GGERLLQRRCREDLPHLFHLRARHRYAERRLSLPRPRPERTRRGGRPAVLGPPPRRIRGLIVAHTTRDGPSGRRAGAALPSGSALVAVLLVVEGGAWLLSARLATPDMRLGVLTGPATMSASRQMGMPAAMSMGLGVFIGTWTVMMVAMMVP